MGQNFLDVQITQNQRRYKIISLKVSEFVSSINKPVNGLDYKYGPHKNEKNKSGFWGLIPWAIAMWRMY